MEERTQQIVEVHVENTEFANATLYGFMKTVRMVREEVDRLSVSLEYLDKQLAIVGDKMKKSGFGGSKNGNV